MMGWSVGQHIDQPRHLAIDGNPVLYHGPLQSGGVSDGWNVQQQIRRAAKGRVYSHGVTDAGRGENVLHL